MRFFSLLTAIVFFSGTLSLAQSTSSASQSWISVGPDGGDVRALSADPANPSRVLLGTSAGQIYQSEDAGKTWQRFVRIGKGNDYVVDHIIFDPKQPGVIYVAAWTLESEGGSVFKSTDNGHTWQALSSLEGKSVRSMAIAASDPNILVAGTLDGIYRTRNGGQTWQRISPETSGEIKNIESIAVDPTNADIVYAGTWHLPWKTSDGGQSWHNIKSGIIDDSDVFSIIIDPKRPDVIYASACSGIYKSENAGELFHKIQGIPFSARRTRVLKQDPSNSNVVYAGTTEGLWKTSDAGKTWRRITTTDVIVNDVLVDVRSPEHV
ncbi:MAG: transcriptional regulator, partial [Acidobacteria bacterium]